jgi:Tfp pilus tip-associated adhesin PilY1
VGLLVGLVGGSLSWSLVFSTPALATCHHFTVTASPTSVSQGGKVTVTVRRNAAAAPSNVRVSTVDGSAKAPADSKLDQNVSFTTDTSRTFSVTTAKDSKSDPAETFKLHLSNPGGCVPDPNYVLDPDVTVTILANTVATPKATAHAPKPTAISHATSPAVSSAPTFSPAPSASPEVKASPETTLAPQAATTRSKRSGLSALEIAGIVVGGVAVISAVALFIYRRRLA